MERLDKIWSDNDMEGLPFSSSVNEARILKVLEDLQSENILTPDIITRVKQWIIFNKCVNNHIEPNEEYVTWVYIIYSKIEKIITSYNQYSSLNKNITIKIS